ncbi:hypothetical protein M758_UG306500 [Ceratodon purpureus]|nr:hypothetical protein M758_UG306500 [Ceratodon purpureus]
MCLAGTLQLQLLAVLSIIRQRLPAPRQVMCLRYLRCVAVFDNPLKQGERTS